MRKAKQSTAKNVMVFMVDSTDHVTGKASLTLTITASKDGAAFASISPTVTDRGSGWYNLALTSSHTDTLGDLALHITGAAADPTDMVLLVEAGATDADVSSRMATYTQPTGFLSATFPSTVASPTNITSASGIVLSGVTHTGAVIPTVTTLTNLPAITAGWLTASGIAASALNGKGDWLLSSSYTAPPSSATIAGAVWDVTLSGHLTAGSTGYALNAAGAAGDPWTTALPGAYSAGSAGYIVGTNLNATVSSRMATFTYTAPDNASITAIKAKTDNLPSDPADESLIEAAITAATSPLATAAALATVSGYVDTEVAAIKAVTDKLDTALVIDGAVYKYTTNALENAPAGGGGGSDPWVKTKTELLAYGTDTAGYGQAMLLLTPNVPVVVTPAGPGTTTAADIIDGALRLLQVLGEDVTLSAAEANDALEALNLLLDSWSNESLTVWHVTQEVFNLTANHNPHTWGDGGDFDSVRPTRILGAKVRLTSVATPVDIPIEIVGFDDYAAISAKTIMTAYPNYLYVDNAWPLANVNLWPVPDGTSSLVLYSEKPHTSPVLLTTQLSFPPGYFRALKYNLACELAPEYQVTAGPDIQRIAVQSLATIKRKNWRPQTLTEDPAVMPGGRGRRFNIYSGQ